MTTKGPPTTVEVRKAFRAAVDAVDLSPEQRRIALEAFKTSLGTQGPDRLKRRLEQNTALENLDRMVKMVSDPSFVKIIQRVIRQNSYTSGQLWRPSEDMALLREDGLSALPPVYGDPTGEEAIWDEMGDRTGDTITEICTSISNNLVAAKELLKLSSIDVRERAERTIPQCLACGDDIYNLEDNRGGFDVKCAVRIGRYRETGDRRADRGAFIAFVQAERQSMAEKSESDVTGP